MEINAFVVGLFCVGAVIGLCASSAFLLMVRAGSEYSIWLVVPIFVASGALAMIVVTALAVGAELAAGRPGQDDSELESEVTTPSGWGLQYRFALENGEDCDEARSELRTSASPVWTAEAGAPEGRISHLDATSTNSSQESRGPQSRLRLGIVNGGIGSDPARGLSGRPRLVHPDGSVAEKGSSSAELQPSSVARMLPISEAVVERLFGRLVELRPEWVPGPYGVVGYLGADNTSSLRAIASWAGPDAEVVFASSMEDTSWREIEGLLLRAGVFFVDADFMGDVGETVDLCLRLRNRSPHTPLVLISSEVRDHDLTAERAAICDATLKTPLTARSIQMGISAAHRNASRANSVLVTPSSRQRSSRSSRAVSPRSSGREGHLRQL